MKHSNPSAHIRFVFFVMGLALVFAWNTNASAAELPQLSIAQNGQVMVRGAVVTSVSGYTVTAISDWGDSSITWTIRATGSTSFVPRSPSSEALKAIRPGDTIEFSGNLALAGAPFTVTATYLHDSSLIKYGATVQGRVLDIERDADALIVDTGEGTSTIAVTGSTTLLRDGNSASLSDVTVGDTVSAWGILNTAKRVLDADRASFKAPAVSMAAQHSSIFSTIFSWLAGSRGMLSIRDR